MTSREPSAESKPSILFCTDFSPTADRAFSQAVEAACRRGAELVLLHVIPEAEAQFWKTYIYEVEGIDAKARRDVDEKIEQAYASRAPEGMVFRVEIRIGQAAREILDLAETLGAELIVLGRRGHSALAELVFGSVTDRVVRGASCPVLVVPEGRG